METDGVQSKEWSGYFLETDCIGGYSRCMVCGKIPSLLYYNKSKFFNICHCPNCKEEDYKPKTWWAKFWIALDKKLERK